MRNGKWALMQIYANSCLSKTKRKTSRKPNLDELCILIMFETIEIMTYIYLGNLHLYRASHLTKLNDEQCVNPFLNFTELHVL